MKLSSHNFMFSIFGTFSLNGRVVFQFLRYNGKMFQKMDLGSLSFSIKFRFFVFEFWHLFMKKAWGRSLQYFFDSGCCNPTLFIYCTYDKCRPFHIFCQKKKRPNPICNIHHAFILQIQK